MYYLKGVSAEMNALEMNPLLFWLLVLAVSFAVEYFVCWKLKFMGLRFALPAAAMFYFMYLAEHVWQDDGYWDLRLLLAHGAIAASWIGCSLACLLSTAYKQRKEAHNELGDHTGN